MDLVTVFRKGFSKPSAQSPDWSDRTLQFRLGDAFPPVWDTVLACGARYALLLDDAVDCRAQDVRLLLRILSASATIDGLTLEAPGIASVYGVPTAKRGSRVPWTVSRLAALPAWLALLRVDAWREDARMETPEFFLLHQGSGRSVARVDLPALQFDAITWAGDLVTQSSTLLAADYAVAQGASLVPPQLQVVIPGGNHWETISPPSTGRPRFSVICPSIRPDFLREAVQSVVAQTWDSWELWIGFDGPKKVQLRKLAAILEEYRADPRIHIRNYEHCGTGPTRRRLAENAAGDFILGLDDDDRLPAGALERFARVIDEHPECVLLRGGTRVFGLCETYLPPRPRYLIGGIPNDLFEVNQPWAVRRDVLASLGGFEWDPDLKNAGEDSDLFLKIDRQGLPVVIIDEPLYERRLSTLNQTLDCTSDECLQHVRFLYAKHNPLGWRTDELCFSDQGTSVGMRSVHRHLGRPEAVVCSTSFMNFQQVGSRDSVVLDLEVTSLCNAVCTFCPREHLVRHTRFMSREMVERVAQSLKSERGKPLVVLCGIGEPTLHPELEDLVGILARAESRVCLTTNGSKLTLQMVDALVGVGLSELNVSLNAITPETHAAVMNLKNFEMIAGACRQIAAARASRWPALEFHVSFVVTDKNASEADEFVSAWRMENVSQVWLHRLTNRHGLLAPDCHPGNINALARKYAGDPRVVVDMFPEREGPSNLCRVAQGVDFISVDGDMLLCAQDYQSHHKFGSVAQSGLTRLHEVKLLAHLRGETSTTCSGCTFCPPSFRSGYAGPYSIVQAGAV